jgi:hypothetical protein
MIVSIAVFGFLAPAHPEKMPSWQTNYVDALRLGRESKKPLAVFISSGQSGWNKVSKDGVLSKDANRILASDYVCFYLNTDQASGRRLADAFEMTDSRGLVIGDASGKLQAFRHEGDLRNEELTQYLQRFADPERVVKTTESVSVQQYRNYAPEEDTPPSQRCYFAPPVYYRAYSTRSC